MNAHIRKIALQAGLDIRNPNGYDVIHQKPDMFDINLFAELLLKRCMALSSDEHDVKKIREYFGIEGEQS